jgi:hypothetical protein
MKMACCCEDAEMTVDLDEVMQFIDAVQSEEEARR